MIKKITWTIIILLLANIAWSQSKQIHFNRLTIDDGLSLSSVYCIYQDSKGFMWFGTEDGLNRYDGKNFRIFRPDPLNSNSISHKWIDQIYEDRSGILWFSSRGGITRFDPKTEIFTQYTSSAENTRQITNDTIICTLEDNNNEIWVGTLNGLNRIDLKTHKASKIKILLDDYSGLSSRINDLELDNNSKVWIGTDSGLFFYDNNAQKLHKVDLNIGDQSECRILSLAFKNDELWIGTDKGLVSYFPNTKETKQYSFPDNKSDQIIEKIYFDTNDRLWVGHISGLFIFDINKESFKNYVKAPEPSNSQSINPIKSILEDSHNNIWYGTYGTGLYKIDTNNLLENYKHNPSDQKSISANTICSVFEDRAGVLWIGSFGAGINIYDPQSHKFDLTTNDPNEINSISSNFIWSIMEANDGSLWFGTNSNGISRYFPKSKKFTHYNYNPNDQNSLSNPTIRYIFQDSKDRVWIATNGGGLNRFIPETGKFKHYLFSENDINTISNNYIRGIYEDSNGNIWVGTLQGLNRLDPITEKFKRYFNVPNDTNSLSQNYIYTGLNQDKNGNLWIGTIGGGLNKMNLQDESFKSYLNDPRDPESLSDDMVFWIYEDENEFIWVGTNSGLNRFNPKTEKFIRFGTKDGLPSEVIYGILPDEDNNIWLSTNYGLSRFNLSDYTTKNYDINDGLQSNEFNGGALHLGKSGKMYFGGVYGVNTINPKKLKTNDNKSELVISSFEIFGQKVNVLDPNQTSSKGAKENKIIDFEGDLYFHESISYTKKIILDYSQNFFSIEFAALNTSLPDKIQYAYIMENLDKDWNYSGNRNFVSYARLKPGKYIFIVKAQNPDGLWSDSVATLKIIVKPPFWLSWWFILIGIFVAFNLIMLVYRYLLKSRTNKLLKAQNDEITKVNFQLCESERNLKELNDTKDKFFSIISHDLKNPFSSLLSISESVSDNFQDVDDEDKLTIFNKIHDSVQQIYNLLNNLLTWSRSQREKVNFDPVEFNLSQLIDINLNLHRTPAEKKGISLVSNYQESITTYADREMINTVLRNLISNALKFTSEGGSIEIATQKEDSFIEVSVKDKGIGISEENLKKLFRIDVKYKSTGTSGEKGTGLGLILCKEFVEKNNGQIKVESKVGKGSSFSFTIPCN